MSSCHVKATALLRAAVLIVLLLPYMTASAAADEQITPYRPSVSSPAQLPAPGQLEFELGGLHSRTDGLWRDSLPYQFKLAFTPQWGLLLGGEAFVSTRDSGSTDAHVRGLGDTMLVFKRAHLIDDATAFGLELGVKLPTAHGALGSGRADYDVNAIFSRDIGSVHMDANLNATRIGLIDPGTGRTQTGLSTSFTRALAEKLSLTAELAGTARRGTASTAQVLLALGYSPSKHLAFDIGIICGLNPASPSFAIFTGVVVPVARLW